ncbi:hypothetical protein BVRB_6g150940 [Beta vulgaris subsp. vulgaris]|nr:hypothetical protein BVRB_6g150940 [Beta vulgaris subsp. vulgaris]
MVEYGSSELGRVLGLALCWPALSKLGVDPWALGEGLSFLGSRVEGTA